jgi:hypothetical protein
VGIEVLAGVGLASSAASGIMGAFGADKKADAEQQADFYKAQVAKNNAIIAERNAAAATEAGGVAGQVNDLKTKNLVGQQLVTQAANGLDVNSGTNVAVRQSTADLGHLDTLTIIQNAAKQAAGFRAQGTNFTAESDLQISAGNYAREAGDINIATSLLGGATGVADKWAGYKSKGIF